MKRVYKEILNKYKKTGGGSCTLKNGKIIKPNEVFFANADDIPETFSDLFLLLEGTKKAKSEKSKTPVVKRKYFIQHLGGGWYEIKDENGKVLSDSKLKKEDAEDFLTSMFGKGVEFSYVKKEKKEEKEEKEQSEEENDLDEKEEESLEEQNDEDAPKEEVEVDVDDEEPTK
jgi:hypothetical protein